MNLDLVYLPEQDRMRFSVRAQADWLITRSLLLKLLDALLQKLDAIDLPAVNVPLGQRDIALEHALSLEFDGPYQATQTPPLASKSQLLHEVSITIDPAGTLLVLRSQGDVKTEGKDEGEGIITTLQLTRMQSHMVLEMLAKKARAAHWLDAHPLPQWLGSSS
jgi:hypothetical protein